MATFTPLRYPGGKAKIYNDIKDIINRNFDVKPVYCEPFAGGSGLALMLLFKDIVSEIHLNDLDEMIYSFWYSVLNHTDELVSLIKSTEITLENWDIQKNIYNNPSNFSILEKGFATLFLNRTNRSGIMKAGPIGGRSQSGNYKLNCRFNKDNIITLILQISNKRNHIFIYNLDAKDFITLMDQSNNNAFIYLDPPYVNKGPDLYKNSFVKEDHIALKKVIDTLINKWFITYDDVDFIEKLYSEYRMNKFKLNYSISTSKIGTEISIYSKNLD